MKRIIKLILTFIILTTLIRAQNLPRLYKKCLPSIVKISVQRLDGTASEGTGFFVDPKTIITCYHIVDNVNTIQVETSTGHKFTVDSVISSNKSTDLIKFTVKERSETWLSLSDVLPYIGESVFVIGNPDDFDFSISNGIVASIRMKNSVQVIQCTAPCSPGNSGSPLMDKKGKVIGVMSFVKFAGQNLNFAATSLNVINMQNDNSIKGLTPVASVINGWEMDSIINQARMYFKKSEYKNALNTILPVTKFADSTQSIEFIKLIADCHFFLQNYSEAAQYYDALIKSLHSIQKHSPEDVFMFAQAMQNLSMCYFILGDKSGAIDVIEKAADVCKEGLQMDTLRKQIYILTLQIIYATDAMYKYAADKLFEACISWRIAKQYGYIKDDYGFNDLCK